MSVTARLNREIRRRRRAEIDPEPVEFGPPVWTPWPGENHPQRLALISDADELFFGGSVGGGKLLRLDEPVPTPTGWTTVGELSAGSEIFGADGRVCRVIYLSPINPAPESYRLTFDDGTTVESCADHLWLTFDKREMSRLTRFDPVWRAARRACRPSRSSVGSGTRKAFTDSHRQYLSRNTAERNRLTARSLTGPPTGSVRTTREIFETLVDYRGQTNHAIPVAESLDLPDASLPFDPYLLGVWLGDGTTKDGAITSADPEIVEQFFAAGFICLSVASRPNNKSITYRFKGLRGILRSIFVFGNKHIPGAYLRGSRQQRLSILQGLMDTDGTACKSGSVEFTTTRRSLADGVYELIVSLGWKARIVESRATLYGRDCGPKWDIKWTPSDYVFRLERKRSRQKMATRRTTKFRYIVDCQPCDQSPMRCIQVDNPSHLFLVGRSMVPTHNTDLGIGLSLTQHVKTLFLRRESTQLSEISTRVSELMRVGDRWRGVGYGGLLRTLDGRRVEFAGCPNEKDKQRFKGRAHDLKFWDELSDFPESIYLFVNAWNRTTIPNQRCRVVAASNPPTTAEGEWVARRWSPWLEGGVPDGALRWYTTIDDKEEVFPSGEPVEHKGETYKPRSRTFIRSRLQDNPALISTGYEHVVAALPEPIRSIYLHGDFGAARQDHRWQLIPTAWVLAAVERGRRSKKPLRALDAVGVDVARGGKDKTVLALRYGNWIAPLIKRPGKETPEGVHVYQLLLQALADGPMARVNIDADGVGSSAYDMTQSQVVPMRNVNPIRSASATDYKDPRCPQLGGFANLRAAMHWHLKTLLDPAGPEETRLILPDDPELVADLTAPRYRLTVRGLLVEPKDEPKTDGSDGGIRQRLGRSTDCGDSVAMSVWEGVQKPRMVFGR